MSTLNSNNQPFNQSRYKDMKEYYPFIMQHATKAEGARTKVHIIQSGSGKTLCGILSGIYDHKCSSGVTHKIDRSWVEQADPDEEMCKKCKKNYLKLEL